MLIHDSGRFHATARYEYQSNRDDQAMTRIGLPTIGTITRTDVVQIDRSTYLGEPSSDFTNSFGDQASLFLAYDVTDQLTIEGAGRRATVDFEEPPDRRQQSCGLRDDLHQPDVRLSRVS